MRDGRKREKENGLEEWEPWEEMTEAFFTLNMCRTKENGSARTRVFQRRSIRSPFGRQSMARQSHYWPLVSKLPDRAWTVTFEHTIQWMSIHWSSEPLSDVGPKNSGLPSASQINSSVICLIAFLFEIEFNRLEMLALAQQFKFNDSRRWQKNGSSNFQSWLWNGKCPLLMTLAYPMKVRIINELCGF